MMRRILILLVFCMTLVACDEQAPDTPGPDAPEPDAHLDAPLTMFEGLRPFRMGFSTFPHAISAAGVDGTYDVVRRNSDIYLVQFDQHAVPWAEALGGAPFPSEVQDALDLARANRISGRPLVLVVMPLTEARDDVAPSTDGRPPPELARRAMDDPAYVRAFTNYVSRLADALDPSYIVAGLEVNELILNNRDLWPSYTRFARAVRANLKRRYPFVPVSESITLHSFFSEGQGNSDFRQQTEALLREQDFTAVSYYPFLYGESQNPDAYDAAFELLRAVTRKPIAITETGNIAERLRLPSFGVDLPGTAASQSRYIQALLERAKRDNYLFVINWVSRDYDALTQALPPSVRDFAGIWQDTGLVDEAGVPRDALRVWRSYLEKGRSR